VAGRDPAFNAEGHIDYVRSEVADALRGRDVSKFRPNAAAMDDFKYKGARLHTAIRYGVSQALLHASALSRKLTMAEVIAQEYGSSISTAPIPILASYPGRARARPAEGLIAHPRPEEAPWPPTASCSTR
jgi:methylaspartate ammonia-lyase